MASSRWKMRIYVLAFVFVSAGYAFSQAAAEGAILNGVSSGATAKGATSFGGSLGQAFGNASAGMSGSAPRERPTPRRSAAANKNPGKGTGLQTARPGSRQISQQTSKPLVKQGTQASSAVVRKPRVTIFPASAAYPENADRRTQAPARAPAAASNVTRATVTGAADPQR